MLKQQIGPLLPRKGGQSNRYRKGNAVFENGVPVAVTDTYGDPEPTESGQEEEKEN